MIILKGRPITKKNHQQILTNRKTGKPFISQSKQYLAYEAACLWQLKLCRERYINSFSVCAWYWLPNRQGWPDLNGLQQATADILEKAGIIDNDKNIIHWDGSRIMGVDKDNPRVEIDIVQIG